MYYCYLLTHNAHKLLGSGHVHADAVFSNDEDLAMMSLVAFMLDEIANDTRWKMSCVEWTAVFARKT